MALPPSGTSDEAFVREVDEEYRRDKAAGIWRRYGRWIIAAIVLALVALGIFLYLDHRGDSNAGARGEQYDAALRLVTEGQADKGAAEMAKLASGKDAYAALAKIAQGNLLLERQDAKGAAAKFGEVAGNTQFAQPYRDMALIRQTVAEFDTLKPEAVIQRLKPMSEPNSPWLGSAGEMVAAAYLKAGNRAEAGKMYAQVAQGGETVPESVRARVVQLAGVLGVDATVQAKGNKAQ